MQNKPQRQKAQAMIEFALVLPILMLIIVGLLEVGRAIFMYSSVITASREGSRYGSAAGDNLNGDPLYQDCLGIKNAAKKAGALLNLQNDDIIIRYDHGPNSTIFDTCSDPDGLDENVVKVAGDRIIVEIRVQYNPMIPLFIPLSSMTFSEESARTLNSIISIHNEP